MLGTRIGDKFEIRTGILHLLLEGFNGLGRNKRVVGTMTDEDFRLNRTFDRQQARLASRESWRPHRDQVPAARR